MKTPTVEEALMMLDRAVSQIQADRQTHVALQSALTVLAAACAKPARKKKVPA